MNSRCAGLEGAFLRSRISFPIKSMKSIKPGRPGLRRGVKQAMLALFENVSERLDHGHTDQAFDDFARQATMPFRLGFWARGFRGATSMAMIGLILS